MRKETDTRLQERRRDDRRGLIWAVLGHILVLGSALWLLYQPPAPKAQGVVQVSLWAEGTEQVVKDPAPKEETIADETPKTPAPDPEEKPQEPEPVPPPPAPAPKVQPPPPSEAEIALRKKKKQEEEAAEAARQKALAEAARQKALEEAARQRALAEAAAQKAAEEAARKKALEAARRKAAAEAARKKALADAKRKKAEAERRALEEAFEGLANSTAGISGGTAKTNQMGGSGGQSAYIQAVQNCIEPHLRYNGANRLQLKYKVILNQQRVPVLILITQSSGVTEFDKAAKAAITQCNPFPQPPNHTLTIEGVYRYQPSYAGDH